MSKNRAKSAPAQAATEDVAAPQAAAPTVALRGGIAVAAVKLTGKPYRTKAVHNQGWWATITQAAKAGDVAVQQLLTAQPAPVPAHFVGYCIRRGYLADAKQAEVSAS